MKIAVVGVTGLVGLEVLKVLEESTIFHHTELIPIASNRSVGKTVEFNKEAYEVMSIGDGYEANPDIAIFSAGTEASKAWAPRFAGSNISVIDNSSAWRMDENIPLIVPEINAEILQRKNRIIANPNCSTIQMVVPIAPLHKEFKIRRIVVSTYQSVSGTGQRAVNQLKNESKGKKGDMAYPYQIFDNVFPHGGDFNETGYTSEELKLVSETRKILDDNNIRISATVVRVPVFNGHSEAVNIEFEEEFNIDDVREILNQTEGVIVEDDIPGLKYPMPINVRGKDEIFVGRVRRDFSNANTLNMWIVADNLRKGAATNAVQIAEFIVRNKLI
ncbi:MAG: aspartate-semialdehyde dehydrogenase [Bacteroidota bacterium]|nr:aspartate-semialdehyde dehydrogenase [Bacteroidota bacterium]